jgi:serine/threonine-protein phosphatase 6 regulatory subunit 3
VEEASEDAEKKRIFRFPFIACEIFTCEVDVIMKTLVEDEDLMNLLFSFLKPDHPHGTLSAGYFAKVVICLMMRKTLPLVSYVQGHPEIVSQLVDLIGVTSIMEVLIRLIGADETMYSSYADSMQWLDDIKVLEMIVDKFSTSDCPEVHANAAEILCAVTRYAPPALAAKISSPRCF